MLYQRILVLFLFLVLAGARATGQCPPNIGFENGNFDFWELDPAGLPPGSDRHEIMNAASGADYYGNFPRLCPFGGNYSARLGNDRTGAEAEHLSYTFTVPAGQNSFTLTYFYAIVLQNPDHTWQEQPRFTVKALDVATGQVIGCSTFDFVSSGSLPGFEVSASDPNVVYRNWTPGSLQIDGLAGHTILLEFGTYDCTRGGHFGYAYVDVNAACDNILANAPYCAESNALVLNAPFGYMDYTWYSADFSQVIGNTRTVTLSPAPVTSGYFWVDVVPYPGYGCRDTFKAAITVFQNPPLPQPPDTLRFCVGQPTSPISGVVQSPGCLLQWYTDSVGGVPRLDPPRPWTGSPGLYTLWVSQKALYGCESKRVPVFIRVVASLPLSYTINSTRQCLRGNSFVLTNTCFESLPGIMFVWKTGSGINTPAPPGTPITFSYPAAGTFNGVLQLRNAGNCDVELPVTVVVLPKPTAAIEPSGSNCVGLNAPQVRDATVADPADPVTGWWWEVNGVVATTQVPPAMVPPHGSIRARLAVVSQEGCQSDTVTRNIVIGDQPRAAFSVITACSNDFAELRDQSSLPAGSTGQEVVSWQWSVDGVPVSAGQHPRLLLPGGPHQVQLIAVSNIGCRSAPHDSLIEVRDAPRIGLQWLDSCAGRPFLVQATDSAGGVQQWHWSRSGGRFTPGGAQVTERYPRAGRYAVAVAGSNSFGCTDTLQAVITVYDVPAPLFTDTLAAIAEPVMLDGGGMPGAAYLWSPANGLDSPATARPVALWDENQHYTLLVRSPEGCTRQSEVLVRRMLGPDIYVPDAFTPNGDGKNDLLRPVTVGIRELRYFSVFDRSGQRIFHSIDARLGWDGRIGGAQAGTSTFVYVAEGISYQGKRIFKKGTVTLIR